MAHLIGHLCGFDFSESPHIKGLLSDPAQLASRARQLFIRFITTLTKNYPAVMELEDIHHADDASLDLLTDLFNADGELQLLVLCLARPSLLERRPTWGSGQRVHRRIELKPLDKRESRDLVREILQKVEDVPRNLRDLLVDRAEGNPYYMEELIKMLIDDRVVIKDNEEVWHVEESRLGALNVPYTLLGLLEARLDTLLYPEKLTLQRASVIGRIFYDTALYALDDADETHIADLPGVLAKLVEREFIYERETTNFERSKEYIFAGNMLRDSLYNALLRRQVKTYNRAAADWLKDSAGARASEYAAQIADYYEKGGDTEEAGEILIQAAGRAFNLSAFADAQRLLERTRGLLPEDARIALKLGEIYYHTGNFTAAITELQTVLGSAAADADRAEALAILGEMRSEMGEYHEAVKVLEEALPLARTGNHPLILARALYGLGDANWRLGNLDKAQETLTESLNIAREINATPRVLYAMNRLGTLLTSTPGGRDEAQKLYDEAIALAKQSGNREREMTLVNNMGEIIKGRGNLEQAIENYRRALEISREIGAK
ncbi:MAG TPA: tetratricopeptide repeat protein, partial [Phototrophicaceae bacterium]|nr:tetratricopeptide repeat protein [Phototrophicaceae bacterium]